ncbi:multidrug effflux MFS transporter [Nocardia otitidiscaviarum]|uniref:multidrug effflux MFS transporter n=1 Tax=Nocardia otitidiscaviarum TaxID=1823 RepID=UPI0018943B21|nr:multidrug effflux MFS transporter [Nocardia otitidiscaviarum]MBF6179305.1 multidrug effflux MFS transporter [Nocardia otitidiscaviarum]
MSAGRSGSRPGIATADPAIRRGRLLVVLAGLSGAAPLATDMYVPALPELARSLDTDMSGAQVSLTGFLVGVIVGQLVLGPLSDEIGRRPVLLSGTIGFTVLSVVCALAPTVAVLDVARFGQGVAGAAGIVVARAVVTDVCDDREVAGMYSRLGAITASAPVSAPLAGGAALLVMSWRGVFLVLAGFGALLTAGVWRWVPESIPPGARRSGGVPAGLRSVYRAATRGAIVAPVLALSFGGAAVFAYIASTTFVFHEIYGLTAAAASVVYGVNAVGNMLGSLAYGRLVRHRSPEALLCGSAVAALVGPVTLTAVSATVGSPMAVTWLCLLLSLTAFGVFFPAVLTIAQTRGRSAPGATSALLGGGQFLLGSVAAPIVGLFGVASPAPMAAVMATALASAVIAATITAAMRHSS